MKFFDLLGVHVSVTNLNHCFDVICEWIKSDKRKYICVAPVATIVDCQKDAAYRKIVNQAGLVTPDGMPVVWLGRWRGFKHISRTYGPDLMRLASDQGQALGFKHYFYGAQTQTLNLLEQNLKKQCPRIKIVGKRDPGMLSLGQQETAAVIAEINAAKPDILWIGLGSPKQDYWMAQHRHQLQVPVMVGVGAAFDFLAGVKAQAPKWMQHCGLEWLFRLLSEPRRLWRRYLIGNTVFVGLLIKSIFVTKKKEVQV